MIKRSFLILIFVLACSLCFVLGVSLASKDSGNLDPYKIYAGVNAYRTRQGLPELVYDPSMCPFSSKRLAQSVQNWSHDGFVPEAKASLNYVYLGENLARGQTSEQQVVNEWIKSPTHNKNLVDAHYTNTCVATLTRDGETFIVQEYASLSRY